MRQNGLLLGLKETYRRKIQLREIKNNYKLVRKRRNKHDIRLELVKSRRILHSYLEQHLFFRYRRRSVHRSCTYEQLAKPEAAIRVFLRWPETSCRSLVLDFLQLATRPRYNFLLHPHFPFSPSSFLFNLPLFQFLLPSRASETCLERTFHTGMV